MKFHHIVLLSFSVALICLGLFSCSTPKASWGKGDGMNKNCKNNYASHHSPFNFN